MYYWYFEVVVICVECKCGVFELLWKESVDVCYGGGEVVVVEVG